MRCDVEALEALEALDCGGSICAKAGFLHLIMPEARFSLLSGTGSPVEYTFDTGTARHLFRGSCGIKSFHGPRSHPDGIDVNVRCLDPDSPLAARPFEGRRWEDAAPAIAPLS